MSFVTNTNGSNLGSMFVILDEFEHRKAPHLSADAIADTLREKLGRIQEAQILAFGAPAGRWTRQRRRLQNADSRQEGTPVPRRLRRPPQRSSRRATTIRVWSGSSAVSDRTRRSCSPTSIGARPKRWAFPLTEVFDALQIYLGSLYVNDLTLFGRNYQVTIQADSPFRSDPSDVAKLKVRNSKGEMAPLGTLVDVRNASGPAVISRYNMFPSASINGSQADGVSSGDAIAMMEGIAHKTLPASMGFEWTELTYLQTKAGNTAMVVFTLAVVLVFLVLAAQYESWSLPLAVILVVPMCLLCSVAGVAFARLDINIFTQIGFVVLVGLASKNAILIVEFAKAQREAGVPVYEATLDACRLRLRPHHDDLLRVHPGRCAVGLGPRRRGRNASSLGCRRLQWNAWRNGLRHLSDARLLLRDPAACRATGTGRRDRGSRPGSKLATRKRKQRVVPSTEY